MTESTLSKTWSQIGEATGEHENLTWAKEIATLAQALNVAERFVAISTLGGSHRAGVLVKVSLDKRATWENGIFENSRYSSFIVCSHEKKITQITGWKTNNFRKCKAGTPAEVVAKLQAWVNSHN